MPDTLQALIAARIDHLALRREDAAPARVGRGTGVLGRGSRAPRARRLRTRTRCSKTSFSASSSSASRARRSPGRRRIGSSTHSFVRWPIPGWRSSPGRSTTLALPNGWPSAPARSLVEIRAYHLDQAVEFLTELEGAPPPDLAEETRVCARQGRKAFDRARGVRERAQARASRARAAPDARRALRRCAGGLAASGLGQRSRSRWRRSETKRATRTRG